MIPASLPSVIDILVRVADALKRNNTEEVLRYIGDAQGKVQTELDWTLNSDQDLPAIREYLGTLFESVVHLARADRVCRRELTPTIIEEINLLVRKLTHITRHTPSYAAPQTIDAVEKQNRINKINAQ